MDGDVERAQQLHNPTQRVVCREILRAEETIAPMSLAETDVLGAKKF